MEDNSRSEEDEDYQVATIPSSSRQQRNQAEKQRRDKLNQFISELATLVPMVHHSAKKLDKTSILRLSATFLRMHQMLAGSLKTDKMKDHSIPMDWCELLLEGLEGMLLVVTSTGKIVFVSCNVENILGHHQNDLLGQSLFTITHDEDQEELKHNLKTSFDKNSVSDDSRPERRSFFLRLRQRAASRSDQAQYELVYVEGHLRSPKPLHAHNNKLLHHNHHNKGENGLNTNETVLVALVRPYNEVYVSENSLLEATKEEWITRHLLDGTIVFSDHRISILSGYMAEEVTGSAAFRYMHNEDVRWVMISLRQMFVKHDSYGWSCYRLQSKNGEYIYLRTHGFIELDEAKKARSFICINVLVTPTEGEKLMTEMKKIFTPAVQTRSEPGTVAIAERISPNNENPGPSSSIDPLPPLNVNDKREMDIMRQILLDGIVPYGNVNETSHPLKLKAMKISKSLPSVEVQLKQIKAKMQKLQGRYNRPSVITSVYASAERKRSPERVEEAEVKRLRGSTSVIVTDTRNRLDNYSDDNGIIFNTDLLLEGAGSSFSHFSDDDGFGLSIDVSQSDLWDTPVSTLEEGVLKRHIDLEDRIQSQGVQIQKIEEDLQTVPDTGTDFHKNLFTLKRAHQSQQVLLNSLKQDHQRQQTKERISIIGAEHDIGV